MGKSQDALIANGILKAHNFPTYLELLKKYDDGEHMVGLTQATGTGKTYITAQFIYDECFNTIHFVKEFDHVPAKPKKVLILSPTANLSRQTARVLFNQLGPNLEHASMTATTYAELLYATPEDLAQQFDVIIVDEFHRLGAEKWGPAVQKLLDANTNAKILGLTATPIRYLDEARDMGEELFDGEVVQGPNIADAIKAGILPKPKYILGLYYEPVIGELESAIAKCKDTKKKADLEQLLAIAKRETVRIENLEQIIGRNIKEAEESQGGGFVNGKYIAYCSDVNHSKEVIEQLPRLLSSTNQEVHIYTVNYKLGKNENDKQIEAFKNDNSDAIKVMVSINMFDEGYHIPGVKGVFCFANTTSPIKHFQRIGRAIDEGNRDSTPLIFDFVNNLSCLRAFGTTCCGGTSETDPDEYVSPFKDLPFYMDEKSLTIAEMLTKIEHLLSDRLTPEQWIEVFDEYFTAHPNASSIPQNTTFTSAKHGVQNVGKKMTALKQAYNNGQGTPSADRQIIINWLIENKHADMLKKGTNLTPKQWIEVFEEYFKKNPNATSIPNGTTFTSAKHGLQNIGRKMTKLKQAYNNGQGTPSDDAQIIIKWFISNGREYMLRKSTKIKKDASGGDDDQTM